MLISVKKAGIKSFRKTLKPPSGNLDYEIFDQWKIDWYALEQRNSKKEKWRKEKINKKKNEIEICLFE